MKKPQSSRMLSCLLAVLLIACQSTSPLEEASIASPTPPRIPTDPPLTLTASPTPTITPTPTLTYTPTGTGTVYPSPTALPGDPTSAMSSTGVPDLRPSGTLQPSGATVYSGRFYNVGPHLRPLYEYGQRLGNDAHRFTNVGDCHSSDPAYLRPIAAGDYTLGEYTYLAEVIAYYDGSFDHLSHAVLDGSSITTLFDPTWSDPRFCFDGEDRIACEYRTFRPAIALIFSQPHVVDGWQETYTQELRQVVEVSLEQGVIPVLTTHFEFMDHAALTDETNAIIRQVAVEYNIPLWDFHATSYELPEHGDRGNWHLTISNHSSTDFGNVDSMNYGMSLRNLEALQVLHLILKTVIEGA